MNRVRELVDYVVTPYQVRNEVQSIISGNSVFSRNPFNVLPITHLDIINVSGRIQLENIQTRRGKSMDLDVALVA
jgi:hypothetical protein